MAFRPGTSASETLDGTAANDLFLLSGGDDIYDGKEGFDTLDMSGAAYALYLTNFSTWSGSIEFDVTARDNSTTDRIDAVNFEKLKLSDHDDFVVHWDDSVVWDFLVQAGAGNDTLLTGGGNDSLFGETGDDTLLSGAGNDTVKGGQGHDILGGDGGDDFLFGQKGNDVLWGDQFYEEAGPYPIGSDTMYGGQGQDTLYFEATDIVVNGGGGWDTAMATTAAAVTLDMTASSIEVAQGMGGGDLFDASGKNSRVVIYGEDGQDTIIGGNVGDKLYAGGDSDTLTGSGGNDRFYFPEDWGAANVITDFGASGDNDKIDFTDAAIFDMTDIQVTDMGADTLLEQTADASQTILLQNVDHNTVNQWDFIFATPLADGDIAPSEDAATSSLPMPFITNFRDVVSSSAHETEMQGLEIFGLSSGMDDFQANLFDASDMGLWDIF